MRPISVIAHDITRNWTNVNFAAAPYLRAMYSLQALSDQYGLDSGRDIVSRFLSNTSSWRGEEAKRIRAELKGMLK